MKNSSILDVQNLTKKFKSGDKDLTVLKNISFSVDEGTSCAIVGPSGSGKTTLLGLCAGLDKPSSGSVILKGQSISNLDEASLSKVRNEQIGFVFQSFQLISTLTALENVMVPIELRGTPYREVEALALELLGKVGLADRTHHYPTQLSGGEQQRVGLARAFIHQPAILFADEPTGNLDGETGAQIEKLLFELNESQGTTLIIVTHDRELAAKCNRTIELKNGEILHDSLPDAGVDPETGVSEIETVSAADLTS
ncbi:ABC transporter ATP-binding protein [Rhodohalobacter mucosus]|uniref:ABC transporter n=1 Tax=Rhodohalobacter mucosus TaxID=2079485 RepID=A0A316TR26_9BACT|nr:ABC transporter ATP-binding protein [Rhodohalobacter mucosus]PWN06870.1 ABC transporter [Rhodohalobacter mucosus]